MEKKLTPPDPNQCQVEVPNGYSFMTFGGRPGTKRCDKKPVFLVAEKIYGPDGKQGSMTMCSNCFLVFMKQTNLEDYEISSVEQVKKGEKT